ncbi:Uncharacterised protein [Bordetella pertussis]|nr:Uncharacterised protein [Bordetella pertussis]
MRPTWARKRSRLNLGIHFAHWNDSAMASLTASHKASCSCSLGPCATMAPALSKRARLTPGVWFRTSSRLATSSMPKVAACKAVLQASVR